MIELIPTPLSTLWATLAWLTLATHFCFLLFVLTGGHLSAFYPKSLWLHLTLVIYTVAVQTLDFHCPLTLLENKLKIMAGEEPYTGGFLKYYIWDPFGLQGYENQVALGFFTLLVLINLRPYLKRANTKN